MKKLGSLIISILTISCLSSCGIKTVDNNKSSEDTTSVLNDFVGISFNDASFEYDGREHSITCTGVPSFASVTYDNNQGTEVGTYHATAVINAENYKELILYATLVIYNASFKNITFNSETFEYDGTEKVITCSNVPSYANVKYENNKGTEIGVYNATATITAENYNSLVLRATLTITAPKQNFDEAIMEDETVTYDGDSHTIVPSGCPEGTKITYQGTKNYINVGTYTITCVLSKDGYNNKTLSAKLTITPANMDNVLFKNKSFLYDGKNHSIEVENVPIGSTISYTCLNSPSRKNTFSQIGSYIVQATITNNNYVTKVLTATLDIVSGDQIATIDSSKPVFIITEPLMWDTIFNKLMEGNYTLHQYSGYWDDTDPDNIIVQSSSITASDGINSFTDYHSTYDDDYHFYYFYTNCGIDAVETIYNYYNDGKTTQSKLPSAAMDETIILNPVGRAFAGVQEDENGVIISGVDLDDYYSDVGTASVKDNKFVIHMEHPRSLDGGAKRYFYRAYEFYNIGNTKLNIPDSYFLSQDEIDSLGVYSDFIISGVRYGSHLVSTYNSPTEYMAHTYLAHYQRLILKPGVYYIYPGFYGKTVQRVVYNYYTEQYKSIFSMEGYEYNVYFDSDGNYQGEYASYGSVTDRTSGFVNHGGVIHYYDEWINR